MKKIFYLFLFVLNIVVAKDLIKLPIPSYSYTDDKTNYDEIFNEHCGKALIDISVQPLKTNRHLIDDYINKKLPTEEELNKYVKTIKINTVLGIDKAVESSTAEKIECSAYLKFSVNYIGHYKNFEIFSTNYSEFSAAARGIYSTRYYIFDEDDKLIDISQIILLDKEDDLMNFLVREYLKLMGKVSVEHLAEDSPIIKFDMNKNLTEQLKKALQTDNFYFTSQGLVFSYPPYAIAPIEEGEVELTIPFRDLSNIVSLEYLP